MTKARDLASAAPAPSTVSATELGYLDGVSSAIQTQIDGKSGTAHNHNSDYIAKTLTTTTGDMIYASSANNPARLGIGSTGNVLTVSGGVPTWAAPAGGGKVLQVVTATYATSTQSFSTTYADTGLSASITPSATSSKVLVIASQNFWIGINASSGYLYSQLLRGSTALQVKWFGVEASKPSGPLVNASENPFMWLDSPNTTSSTTYKTQFKLGQADVGGWGGYANYGSTNSSITLLEIGA